MRTENEIKERIRELRNMITEYERQGELTQSELTKHFVGNLIVTCNFEIATLEWVLNDK